MAQQKYAGNPNVDQSALVYADLEGMVGADVAKVLFIPKADETLAIEAARKQQQETFYMGGTGLPISVSPRDNHLIEGGAVIEFLTNAIAPLLSSPKATDQIMKAAELNLNHLGEHLEAAAALGQNKLPAFAEEEKFYEGFKKQLAEVVQIREQAKVAQSMVTDVVRTEAPGPNGSAPAPAEATSIPGDFEAPIEPESAPTLAVG